MTNLMPQTAKNGQISSPKSAENATVRSKTGRSNKIATLLQQQPQPSLDLYRKMKPQLLKEGNEGKFIIIKDGQLLGIYESEELAYANAYQAYGYVSFFFKQILKEEVPVSG